MDLYYANQATSLPHFSGIYRKERIGFGALAASNGQIPSRYFCWKDLTFICITIIENKCVGDVKAPLLRVIDSKRFPKTLVLVSLNQLIKYFSHI